MELLTEMSMESSEMFTGFSERRLKSNFEESKTCISHGSNIPCYHVESKKGSTLIQWLHATYLTKTI